MKVGETLKRKSANGSRSGMGMWWEERSTTQGGGQWKWPTREKDGKANLKMDG